MHSHSCVRFSCNASINNTYLVICARCIQVWLFCAKLSWKKETCISLFSSLNLCVSDLNAKPSYFHVNLFALHLCAKNIKDERHYWRNKAKLFLNLLKSNVFTIITICCFFRGTVMTTKQCRWDYETFQWNWQQACDILQKKDSDGLRQECEVQLHTYIHWFSQYKSTFLSLKHGVTCTLWGCYLLDGDSLLHTRKERKKKNHKCLVSLIISINTSRQQWCYMGGK